MFPAIIAKIIKYHGSVLLEAAAYLALAVEQSHRVAVKSFEAGAAKLILILRIIFLQCLVVFRTALRTAYAVYLKAYVLYAKTFDNVICKCDNFSICRRRSSAEIFDSDLIEFTEAAALRSFISEATCEIICFKRKYIIKKSVFDNGTDSACCTLRLQRYASALLIVEGVHFLLYNVGSAAYSSLEKLGVFKRRCTNLLTAVCLCYISCNFLNCVPLIYFLWQFIFCSSGFFGY